MGGQKRDPQEREPRILCGRIGAKRRLGRWGQMKLVQGRFTIGRKYRIDSHLTRQMTYLSTPALPHAESSYPTTTPESPMPPTLSTAREDFIRHMYRDNVLAERPRLLAVLDAVIAWSAAHSELVRFRPDENTKGVIRFE